MFWILLLISWKAMFFSLVQLKSVAIDSNPITCHIVADKALIACDDGNVCEISLASMREVRRYSFGKCILSDFSLNTESKTLALEKGLDDILLLDANTLKSKITICHQLQSCLSLLSGDYLFVGCHNNTVHIFDANSGKKLFTLDPSMDSRAARAIGMSVANDGKYLIIAHANLSESNDRNITIWDFRKQRIVESMFSEFPLYCLANSSDSQKLWIAGERGYVEVRGLMKRHNAVSRKIADKTVTAILLSPDQSKLYCWSEDGWFCMLNASDLTVRSRHRLASGYVYKMSTSSDGQFVAFAVHQLKSNIVYIIDTKNHTVVTCEQK